MTSERKTDRVEIELRFRAVIEVYRDEEEGSPDEIAEQLYQENDEFDDLLAAGKRELDTLRILDRCLFGADIEAEISFADLTEEAFISPEAVAEAIRKTNEADQIVSLKAFDSKGGPVELPRPVELSPTFTDRPELDQMTARVELPGPHGPQVYETTFAKAALANSLRRLLGFDKAAEKLRKVKP